MSYPNIPITQTPDWVRRAGQAINYLLNNQTAGGGGTTTFSLTFNNGGAGAASGTTFDGSVARTVSYNTIGAQPLDGTLTALSGVSWSAGTQVVTLTAADTFTLKTVGSAAGNILDKAAGDTLYQPLDSDLTAIAALSGTNTIYYRSAANTWSAVTIGSGLTFSGGTLTNSGSAFTLIESLSPSAVSSITSEAWAGGTYKSLRFVINLVFATDADQLELQYKLNGSYKTTANYRFAGRLLSSSGSTNDPQSAAQTFGALSSSGVTWGIGNNSLEGLSCDLIVPRPFSTAGPHRYMAHMTYIAPSGSLVSGTIGGHYEGTDNASALEGIKFLTGGGNMTGTIDVYGLS